MAFAVLVALEAFSLEIAWSQEPANPRLKDEIVKQEKIYGSRGADVPSGYVTGRGLADYAELLPSAFCDTLGKLRSSHRWLDIGAGEGQAILTTTHQRTRRPRQGNAPGPAAKCSRSRCP